MPRRSYGSIQQKRAKRLLEALLDYAKQELELDETFRKKLKVTFRKDGLELSVIGTLELLTELTNARHSEKLTEDKLGNAIAYLENFLEILKRETQQGSPEWRLTIALWDSDKEKNLKAFERECERKNKEKKPEASQDPWVRVRKFVPSEFELLDNRFFQARGRGDSPILRLPSATWSLITQGNYIDRERQEDLLTQAQELAEYDGISLLLIRGEPGAGKTALMRWLAYQLSSQESIVLQKNPRRDELYWLEPLWEFSEQNHYQHFYLIVDDVFRDETILEELERNELQFPLTLIGTTRLNEDQQERLRRWGYPIKSLDLELYPSEKERIWQRVCQQDSEAKARLEQMPRAERDRLMASPSMLVLMLQLSEGKDFDSIVGDVIKRLPSQADYPVYQVFGVICSFYQYGGMITPPEILPLCLPDYSSKAVRDVVDIATETQLKGLVNTMSRAGFEGLGTIHALIAQTAITVKYTCRPGENLPYSPRLLEDYLPRAIQALAPTQETHKRWAYHGLRRLAVNGEHNLVRQVLNDYPETIQWLQQESSSVTSWLIWAKVYEAVGLLNERDRCLNALFLTEPETIQERFSWLCLIARLGTNQQKQQAITQTATWLQHHPEAGDVRTIYLVLVGKAGKDIIDVEPIIAQQWQWISQQPKIQQSLWVSFLPVLHYHAQLHPNLVAFIQPAINLALEQYPEDRNIISNVFSYFRDYLDYKTCYRLAEVISEYRFIKEISFWRHFIYAANFFRDLGDLDKAETLYRRVLNTSESWLNQQKGDIKNLQKTLLFAGLSYAYLLLIRQPPDLYRAIEYLNLVLDDNPKHQVAHCYMAQCYQAKGKKFYPQAIRHFEKAIQFDREKTGHFWYQFGCFYRDAMESGTEARKCFKNSLNEKINLPACIDLAELEVEAGNWETAKELLEQGLALVPIIRPEKEQREKLQPRIDALQRAINTNLDLDL